MKSTSHATRRWLTGLGWVAVLLALAVVAAPQLLYPLGFDQAVYAACGDVIRRGGVPIKDCFETKQMGIMLMYALAYGVAATPIAIHALTLLWTAATAWLIARLTGRLFGGAGAQAGAWAGILYWLMYAGIHYWSMDQAETFTNLLLALGWLIVIEAPLDGRGRLALIGAGVAAGVAIWFKYVFALNGIALGLVVLFRAWRAGGLRGTARAGLAFAGGTLGLCALVLAYFALVGGLPALEDQLQTLRDNFPLAAPLPLPGVLAMLARFADNGADLTARFKATLPAREYILLGAGFPFVIGLAVFGAARHLRARGLAVAAGLGLTVAALAVLIWQGNYIQYHYTLLLLPVAALAGAACLPASGRTARALSLGARGLAVAACALLIWRMVPVIADAISNTVVQGKTPHALYLESEQAPAVSMADQLTTITQPGDTISIIGDAPWVYTLAQRENATRFSFVNIWLKKTGSLSHERFIAQMRADLERRPPALILLTRADYPWQGVDYGPDYKAATPLYDFVESHYRYIGENGPFLLFGRK